MDYSNTTVVCRVAEIYPPASTGSDETSFVITITQEYRDTFKDVVFEISTPRRHHLLERGAYEEEIGLQSSHVDKLVGVLNIYMLSLIHI